VTPFDVKNSCLELQLYVVKQLKRGPGSSVGIATGYGPHGPGIESNKKNPGGARFSARVQTGPGAHPSLLYNGYRVFPEGRKRPGRDANPSPLLVP
jgi:hypothetical protein